MSSIKDAIKRILWRYKNKHNLTTAAGKNFPLSKVEVGRWTYGPIHAVSFGGPEEFLKIGSCCSIANDVTFLLGGGHVMSRVSTYPFRAKVLNTPNPHSIGPTVIDDDVWIGYGATILGGVHVGQGAVIGAKALVTKDIPPYAVVGGCQHD
jgi:virginiamycin A acetyltransferase